MSNRKQQMLSDNLPQLETALKALLENGLSKVLKHDKIDLVEGAPDINPFWKAYLLGLGEQMVFEFTIRFRNTDIAALVPAPGQKQPSDTDCSDFVKELCNVLSGKIQNYFFDYGIQTGLSLPILSRGFDDYLTKQQSSRRGELCALWETRLAETPLFYIDLKLKPATTLNLEQVEFKSPDSEHDEDQIELL